MNLFFFSKFFSSAIKLIWNSDPQFIDNSLINN